MTFPQSGSKVTVPTFLLCVLDLSARMCEKILKLSNLIVNMLQKGCFKDTTIVSTTEKIQYHNECQRDKLTKDRVMTKK